MTTTDLNSTEIERPPEPGSIGAGAEIYRRMERRAQKRPLWMTAAPIVGLVIIVAGGVIGYQAVKPHAAPAPAPVQTQPALPPVALAPIAPKPARVAIVTPTRATPAPVARAVRTQPVRPALAAVSHRRTVRRANAAASAGQDTSADTPAPAAPSGAVDPPTPMTVSPPPSTVSATPAAPPVSQTTPQAQP